MTQQKINKDIESQYTDVYGKTFALYNKDELIEFIHPFEVRFERNQLDANAIFEGKKCLDAGCGGGRGSVFMLKHGAQHVTAVDYSELNTQTTKTNTEKFGFTNNIDIHQYSLEELPFEDETFDFVWCNGVLQHTENPDKCFQEISRVLKKDGQAWIYVYGSGGLYWYCIDRFRDFILDKIESDTCTNLLRLCNYTPRFVAEYLDDWKVPFLRKYTVKDMNTRLEELGYENPQALPYGMDYDTNHMLAHNQSTEAILGEGDIRYLITKKEHVASKEDGNPISSTAEGSQYTYDASIAENVEHFISEIETLVKGDERLTIIACAYLQYHLRDLMSDPSTYEPKQFEEVLKTSIQLIKDLEI